MADSLEPCEDLEYIMLVSASRLAISVRCSLSRTWRSLGAIGTTKFVKKPVRWRTETLLMFLGTSTHVV